MPHIRVNLEATKSPLWAEQARKHLLRTLRIPDPILCPTNLDTIDKDMAPPRKKHKADSSAVDDGPPPIIFASPALKTDVRLMIFEQAIEVHSVILKLYSNYFRKFLDSPDKSGAPASALFRYEYVSVIDEDGSWALEPSEKAPEQTDKILSRLDPSERLAQLDAFKKLLCAMYHRPYTIETPEELEAVTTLADFYCALPILSATLSDGLDGSPMFGDKKKVDSVPSFAENAPKLLLDAYKIRHKPLFRDCLIIVVGRWRQIRATEEGAVIKTKPDIYRLILEKYQDTCELKEHLNRRLLENMLSRLFDQDTLRGECPSWMDKYDMDNLQFYRELDSLVRSKAPLENFPDADDFMWDFRYPLKVLLANNLSLDRSAWEVGEVGGPYESCLLCAKLENEDVPWDTEQIDW